MKSILKGAVANKHDYDGWALKIVETDRVLWWTFSTTRQEARDLKASELGIRKTKVVKAKVNIVEVNS